MHGIGQVVAVGFSLVVAAAAYSQAEGQPGRPGGPPDGNPRDPARFVERLMEADADGDGKLSASEIPPQLADRIPFERIDSNKDGTLDRAELDAFAKAGGMGRGGRPGAEAGAANAAPTFEAGMKAAGRSLRNMRGSAFDSASRASDLEAVQGLQAGLIAAKGQAKQAQMSAKAKAKFGEDHAAFEAEMRRSILKAMSQAIELELAILEGKSDQAATLAKGLANTRDESHSFFQDEEEEAPRERPGRAGRGGRTPAN